MTDTPLCEHCNEVETIDHRLLECTQAKNLWEQLAVLTNRNTMPRDIDLAVGAYEGCDKVELSVHAELIMRLIRQNRTGQTPIEYIKSLVRILQKKEKGETKRGLESLLQ